MFRRERGIRRVQEALHRAEKLAAGLIAADRGRLTEAEPASGDQARA